MEPLHPDDPRELGGYRLLRRVGEGGMGVVYLATSADGTGTGLAAVKAVRPEYAGDREFRARFTVEADLARRVRGPYTARVLDADTDGTRPWLATEYVPGPALHDAVRETGPFPESSLLALASGLARALSAIHQVGLVHRDLKPSNVLLSTRGPQVIDFGIARAADATALTRTGQALGTPAYMSPEQATGSGLHGASDLFSFGGVLVFAATGRAPFGAGAPAALLYRVVNEEPDLSGLPDRLWPLVNACLAKNPEERPELGAVVAELTGTALPSGDDDPTEWLPAAVDATVHHTLLAATRILPGDSAAEQAGSSDKGVHEGGPGADEHTASPARTTQDTPEQSDDKATEREDAPERRHPPEAGPAEDGPQAGTAATSDATGPPVASANGHGSVSEQDDVPGGPSAVEQASAEVAPSEKATADEAPSDEGDPAHEDVRSRTVEPGPAEGPKSARRATAVSSSVPGDGPAGSRTPRDPEQQRPTRRVRATAAGSRALNLRTLPEPEPEDDRRLSGRAKALWITGGLVCVLLFGPSLMPDTDENSGNNTGSGGTSSNRPPRPAPPKSPTPPRSSTSRRSPTTASPSCPHKVCTSTTWTSPSPSNSSRTVSTTPMTTRTPICGSVDRATAEG